jgi:hypothetical protein
MDLCIYCKKSLQSLSDYNKQKHINKCKNSIINKTPTNNKSINDFFNKNPTSSNSNSSASSLNLTVDQELDLSASRSICAESIDELLNKTPSSSNSNNSVLSRNSSIDLELDLSEADTLNSVDVDSLTASSSTLTNKTNKRARLEPLFEADRHQRYICSGFKPVEDLWNNFPFQLLGTQYLPEMTLFNETFHDPVCASNNYTSVEKAHQNYEYLAYNTKFDYIESNKKINPYVDYDGQKFHKSKLVNNLLNKNTS